VTFYRKSSFWSNQDWILYLFIVFGGGLVFATNFNTFLLSVVILGLSFGLYFGVNVFTKKQLYNTEIALELGLDEHKKILQIGNKKIKFGSIKKIKFWYIYRIGWKMTVVTKDKTLAIISPDVKVVVLKLQNILEEKIFNNYKSKDLETISK
jgi:hypothetical protein